tara:strand:+ start:458 stop:1930 length:1473 start_codon:yes stop_codon:yes gene_type:complete
MSQYKGNDTSFKPNYAVAGETKTPINVVATSMEIGGQVVEGYQSTYENGTSKWTAAVHQDQIWDTTNVDRSTFTGTYNQNTGKWTWEPTTKNSIKNLSNDWKGTGVDYERISETEIEQAFYNNKSNNLQQKLSTEQANALIEEYGSENLATVNSGRFAGLPGIQGTASGTSNTTTDFSVSESNQFSAAIAAKKTRTQYGDYFYPEDLSSNKQDRVRFTMKQSTGQVIDPTIKQNVSVRQRKSGSIEGSVTLPIQSGIKDLNSVSWQGSTMNPLQAFGAVSALDMVQAAGTEGESVVDAAGDALRKAGAELKNPEVMKGINAMIAGKAVQTQNLLSRATGAIANPNMELLFDAPALRAFDFTFAMSPRDSKEAEQIRNIINFFKQGMSVKTTSTNIFLKAPNYFEIAYTTYDDQGQAQPHPSLNRIKTCALLSCAVDYTPNNSYMTYSDENRSMVQYTMNLQFNELDPIYELDYSDTLDMKNGTNVQKIGY